MVAGTGGKSGAAAWQGLAKKQVTRKRFAELVLPNIKEIQIAVQNLRPPPTLGLHICEDKSYSHVWKISQSCSTSCQPCQTNLNEFQ